MVRMTGVGSESAGVPSVAERLHAFRSLGGNCEFGFMQRYAGADPSGLLRFSYTPIGDLIHALSTDFAEFGAPGDLCIEDSGAGIYYCRSRRYNIWSNTARSVGSIDPESLLQREYGRIAHLKGRMLDELAAGSTILVRKAGQGETEAEFDHLSREIGRHGPSTLLRVSAAGAGRTPDPVRRLGERALEGQVRRFAPVEEAWDLDLESWLRLCNGAYAAVHGLPEASLAPGPVPDTMPLPAGLRRHRGGGRDHGLSSYARVVEPEVLDPARVYVFSTWVWIPEAFSGARVFAVTGQERLGWRDADLAARGGWQRVWAAGRFRPEGARVPVGLAMIGAAGDRFWSCGARLCEGPVPPPAAPPAVVPEPALRRWLSRWRG